MTNFVKIISGVVVQKSCTKDAGFISAPDDVTIGYTTVDNINFSAPPPQGIPLPILAKIALDKTSVTVERIVEATVLNPTVCKMTNQDVIDFMNYRKLLRDIQSGANNTATTLPPAPGTVGGIPFPAGT